MIIGKGLVARNFVKYELLDDFLVFASGVSNSKSCTPQDLQRERSLFQSAVHAHPSKTLVYFSTTSIDDPDLKETPYVLHKLQMETLVRQSGSRFNIFRLSNLAGQSDNPHTILNYFYNSIVNGQPFQLWKYSQRNIIDVADVFLTADHILRNGIFPDGTVDIANPYNYPVDYIVRCIEEHTGKKANATKIEKGGSFDVDVKKVAPIYNQLGIDFGEDYLPRLLKKYYPQQ